MTGIAVDGATRKRQWHRWTPDIDAQLRNLVEHGLARKDIALGMDALLAGEES